MAHFEDWLGVQLILATELESRRILELARWTDQHQRPGALTAELHAGWILKLALRAAHPDDLPAAKMAKYRDWACEFGPTARTKKTKVEK
jgi:hypothetical protein